MLQTVTRPVVSMFAACAYCPAQTSFRCLNCQTPICPDCVPGEYCPDCRPAPVAPLMGFSLAHEGDGRDDATLYAVACATCGETFHSEEPDDGECAACAMPPAELAALRAMRPAPIRPAPAACLLCGQLIYGTDGDDAGTRHRWCRRFIDSLDARRSARTGGDALAA